MQHISKQRDTHFISIRRMYSAWQFSKCKFLDKMAAQMFFLHFKRGDLNNIFKLGSFFLLQKNSTGQTCFPQQKLTQKLTHQCIYSEPLHTILDEPNQVI